MLNLFKNKWLIGAILVYLAASAVLFQSKTYSIGETIFALMILGFFFSAVAWLATKRSKRLEFRVDPSAREMFFVAGYIVFVFLYLIWGISLTDAVLPEKWIADPQFYYVVKIVKKLLVFVVLPVILLKTLFGYELKDFGFRREALKELFRSHLPVVIVISLLMLLMQYFIGSAAAPVRRGEFSSGQILPALPLCLTALIFEVGFVEELFYRVILQSRFAAFFRSEVAAIFIVGVFFAVSHAPGMILRQAGVPDGLGTAPHVWEAVAYTITTISLISIMFGIIWIRTRNLFVLVLIHAFTDLLPNLAEFIRVWKI